MTRELALTLLTRENIETTARTLAAIDYLQGLKYVTTFEHKVQKAHPHSESKGAELANASVNNFATISMMGNGQGFKMLLSVFINGMIILEMKDEAQCALLACAPFENLDHPSE